MVRRLVTLISAAALMAAALGSGAGASATETGGAAGDRRTAARPGLNYVAMGDSYSAASGVLPVDPTSAFCLRSTRNYPHVIATATGARLTDVTCGGADTNDYFSAQNPAAPPQLRALSKKTDLVTMTIGGNNGGVFIDTIIDCGIAGASTLGRGAPCREQYGKSFENKIKNKTFPAMVKALNATTKKAPNAEVAILSYPWIMPKREGCFTMMPVARGDVPYVRGIQTVLNNAVRRAAKKSDTTFVNLNRVSNGHDACQPIGVRWVEPVLLGTNPVVVHPNTLGERKMAKRTIKKLDLRR